MMLRDPLSRTEMPPHVRVGDDGHVQADQGWRGTQGRDRERVRDLNSRGCSSHRARGYWLDNSRFL